MSFVCSLLLKANGDRLVMVEEGRETVLLDLGNKIWKARVEVWRPEGKIAFLPAICTVVSRENRQLVGQERDVIVVECSYDSTHAQGGVIKYSLASGVGFVSFNGYELKSLGAEGGHRRSKSTFPESDK